MRARCRGARRRRERFFSLRGEPPHGDAMAPMADAVGHILPWPGMRRAALAARPLGVLIPP